MNSFGVTAAGAAHFLEHMVHLGSQKFPDEKEYKGFLAQHGGTSNASTSESHCGGSCQALPTWLDLLGRGWFSHTAFFPLGKIACLALCANPGRHRMP